MQNLFPRIMGFVVIVITLALAPSIATANTAITGHANVSSMIGMAAIGAFGAPLIILGLLISGGVFALAGMKGQLSANAGDMFKVIGSVVVVIVSLTLMTTVMTYVQTLIDGAAAGFATVIYSLIPLLIYIGVIASTGWVTVSTYRKGRRGKRSSKSFV